MERRINVESGYLDANQEQAVETVLNLAKKYDFSVGFGRTFIPAELRTIRIVLEAKHSRDYLATIYKWLAAPDHQKEIRRAIISFDKVLRQETQEIREGRQTFVAEKDEE